MNKDTEQHTIIEPKMTKELFKRLRTEELERMIVEDYIRPIILEDKDTAFEYGLLVLDARLKMNKDWSIYSNDYTIINNTKQGVFVSHYKSKTQFWYDDNSLTFIDERERILMSIYVGHPYNNFWTTNYELFCEKVSPEYLKDLFARVTKKVYDTITGKEE